MNLTLIDLSNNVKTEFNGQFANVTSRTINSVGKTNFSGKMLDEENMNMDNKQLIEKFDSLLGNNNAIEDLARNTGVTVDKIQTILSGLINLPVKFNEKRGNIMNGESIQIGDRVEINNSGDGLTNNYAGMWDNHGSTKELKTRISDLQKLLKEKDELIAAQKETIELLKINRHS